MTHNPSASGHGDDAEDREPDGIAKIHRGLFSAPRRDVKPRDGIFFGLAAQWPAQQFRGPRFPCLGFWAKGRA